MLRAWPLGGGGAGLLGAERWAMAQGDGRAVARRGKSGTRPDLNLPGGGKRQIRVGPDPGRLGLGRGFLSVMAERPADLRLWRALTPRAVPC